MDRRTEDVSDDRLAVIRAIKAVLEDYEDDIISNETANSRIVAIVRALQAREEAKRK